MRKLEKPRKNRLRRTMLFLNAQRSGLIKDPYIFKPDCIIFDLEDAVSENQKDSARFQLYNALKYNDYQGIELVVRINGVNSEHWREDVRVAVAAGCDTIRIPECESAQQVKEVELAIENAEKEFGRDVGDTLIMGAIETPLGVINSYEIASASPRVMGISIGAADFMRTMKATRTDDGSELFVARSQLVMSARAAKVMCFDTVHTDIDDIEGLERDTKLIKSMGFDGKSVINPRQIGTIHSVFTPTEIEITKAARMVSAIKEQAKEGVGVFSLDGKMVDIAMLEGAEYTLELARAAGVYKEGAQ